MLCEAIRKTTSKLYYNENINCEYIVMWALGPHIQSDQVKCEQGEASTAKCE